MSNPWARPSDDGAPARPRVAEPIEIELHGPGVAHAPQHGFGGVGAAGGDGDDDGRDGEPNWRVIASLATVAGVVLGLVAAGVIFWSSGDDEPSTTTVPLDELAAEITTPPTLSPIDTVPPPTTAPGPDRTVPGTRPITVPTYPSPSGAIAPWPDGPIEFPTLDESLVVSVVTDNAFGDEPTSVEVRWDAVNERFAVALPLPGGVATTIYDVATDSVYEGIVRPRSGLTTWTRTPAMEALGIEMTATEYFSQALLGPVRTDNVDQAITTETDGLVRNVLTTPTRRTTYTMPVSALGLWGDQTSSGVATYDVYADEAGRVIRIQGISDVTGSPQAIVYTPTPADITIELPPEDDVADAVIGGESGVLPTGGTAESLRPRYGTFDPVPAASADQFSIAAALDNHFDNPPAAASVDVLWPENATRITAQRDDANDRRLMTLTTDSSPVMTVQIDDGASAATLLTDDVEGRWTRLTSTGQGGRRPPVDERLISGVLSRSSIEAATVVSSSTFVSFPDGPDTLEVHLRMEPGSVNLPSLVPMLLDGDEPVDVYLYVGAGVVHEIQVLSNTGARLLVQRFDLMARPEITLPDPAKVVDG